MAPQAVRFQQSIRACIDNGKRLLEDAEWSSNTPTGVAIALLAQEEAAKAFVLVLVRDGVLPWTPEVYRSLSNHACKHLVAIIMDWLREANTRRLDEVLEKKWTGESLSHLPADVAIAMNIYRHEWIERLGQRHPERFTEWRGRARKIADGQRDRWKQAALYVKINQDGELISLPSAKSETRAEEVTRGKALLEFADDMDSRYIFARNEFEMFSRLFTEMFREFTATPAERAAWQERLESPIPGVEFVKHTICVATVVDDNVASLDSTPDTTEEIAE